MGTYSKSNFGQISGKVGNAVGGKWRGIDYLRSLPSKSKRAASPDQLAVQAKFALAAATLSPIKDVLNVGFADAKLSGISGYNMAVKLFIANSISGAYPNLTVDFQSLQISKGSLGKLLSPQIGYNGQFYLTWAANQSRIAFIDDHVLALVYNQTADMFVLDESAKRADASVTFDIGSANGDVIHAWVFCLKRDGKSVSSSQYLGTITL
ncbi:MAG: DUF6266 family protein [Pedobacter sp.]|nr:DUF6266 family protein [Pedobacter sp.]